MKRKNSGLTLVELIVTVTITVILIGGLAQAYNTAIHQKSTMDVARSTRLAKYQFEEQLKDLLKGAYVTADTADFTTFFVASMQGGSSGNSIGADTLTFTTTSSTPNDGFISSTETDFEALNTKYGPQGGMEEVSLSTTPYGNAGDATGLFIREQRPNDGDHTQGGFERVLNSQVSSISFEFWDGTNWVTEWDTTTGERRVPAAIRVSYSLTDDPDTTLQVVVRLEHSDVTPQNPYASGGTIGGTNTPTGGQQ